MLSDEQKKALTSVSAGSPDVTYAQVADKLNSAKDSDEIAAAADLIREVKDEQQRTELAALYNQLLEGMKS